MSEQVQARFWVQSIKKTASAGGEVTREVILQPVIRPTGNPGGDGNVSWSKYTPSGEVRLVVTASGAGEWFEERLVQDVGILFFDPADQ